MKKKDMSKNKAVNKKEIKKEMPRNSAVDKKVTKDVRNIKQQDMENKVGVKNDITIDSLEQKREERPISKGVRRLKDLIAPSGFDRTDENSLGVGTKHVRSFVVNGYPNSVSVGWLDNLYHSDYDVDTSFHISPIDERSSLDELNMEITKQEAQLHYETKSGNIKNLGMLQTKIEQLYIQRAKLEQNQERLYHSCITANLHSNSQEDLEKESHALVHTLGARKVDLMSSYLRQDESYKSCLPVGVNFMDSKYRNINTGGIVASFPLYNANMSHDNGIFIGLNMITGTPIFIDTFNRDILPNGNATIFGASGSGKTFLVSLITARSCIKDVATAIIDPEGEYVRLCHELSGKHIEISTESKTRINPFQIEAEYDPDNKSSRVNIKAKIADLINFFAVMCEGIDAEQKSVIAMLLRELYEDDWGITSDPRSLYLNDDSFDKETGTYQVAGEMKIMPTLSDFYNKLKAYVEENPKENLIQLVNSLVIFKKGNVYDLWDTQTSEDLKNLKGLPIVVFDVSKLDSDSVMRPLGMYTCLTWLWESFIKKDLKQKKRIIVDEAWTLCDVNMAGSEYTASFLNIAARRCRKRNASLLIASQSFHEFVENPKGKAVLMNSSINMLLRTEPIAIDAVQQTFKLSDGERNFIMSAKRGEVLIRMNSESCAGIVVPFKFEKELIENPFKGKEEEVKSDDYEEEDEDYDF